MRRLRLERGLSQRQLASRGVTYAYISRIESGQRIPSVRAIRLLARRLGVTPEYLADRAGEIAKDVDLEEKILDPAGLKARGYEGCLRVGSGSAHPPRMAILRHRPARAAADTLTLVGKGITFDSGGISLKPGEKMWEMKGDMAGAAAVLFTMRALGRIRPDVKVVGILCCAENFPDANAQRPGDIFTATPTPRAASCSPTASPARERKAPPTSSTSRP